MTTTVPPTPPAVSLGEFTKCLVAQMHVQRIPMPLRDERPWHMLFFQLKSDAKLSQTFRFLSELQFDWDGPYPKSRELSRFLHALHWNAGVAALNPLYVSLQLSDDVAEMWNKKGAQLTGDAKHLLDRAVADAARDFPRAA